MRQILSLWFMISMFSAGAMSQNLSKSNLLPLNAPPSERRPSDAQTETVEEFVIGPEDVLSIVVWHEPDFTNKVTVRPDGKVGLPLLNDIQASGLTPKQLQEQITEELKKFVTGPQVSVIVQEIHSQIVYVTGAVAKPGVYPLGRPMTITELLVRAGGLADFAKSEDIQILRKEGPDKLRRIRFNYKQFAEGKNNQDVSLRSADMIIVP